MPSSATAVHRPSMPHVYPPRYADAEVGTSVSEEDEDEELSEAT